MPTIMMFVVLLQYDLVDMSLTHTHLWTLWTDSSSETQVGSQKTYSS